MYYQGAGYHMVMVKELTCDVAMVTDLVRSFVKSADLESNVGAELSFILPQVGVHQGYCSRTLHGKHL